MKIPILRTNTDLRSWQANQNQGINFVPTMGALHEGHSKLINAAKKLPCLENHSVLVSIFVNPLQFGPNEDFLKYPRDWGNDAIIAEDAGASAIWIPEYEDIFPGGTSANFQIKVPEKLISNLCGASRKGHFDGVATVIVRLLNIAKPTELFLGEKDWQQLVIIKQLINDLGIPVKVRGVPTFRNSQDLAYSSRNTYLTSHEMVKALALPHELKKASIIFQKKEPLNLKEIENNLKKNGLRIEYIEAVDPQFLTPVSYDQNLCLLAAAVRCGDTRLIDHIFLMARHPIVAIDGPAGAGKSTVTRQFAKQLGLIYLDTGAMYRAVTWFLEKNKIKYQDDALLKDALKDLNLELKISSSGMQDVFLNQQNITNEIRAPKITEKVPLIASKNIVRKMLTEQQQKLGKNGGLVAEGRDIGSAVFPDAELKVFLTASPKERAKRRALDLQKQGFSCPSLLELEEQILERDRIDSSRKIAPLIKSEDARELITDGMDIDEVVNALIDMFRMKVAEEVWQTPID
ncbi:MULTISPECIES: bifunctional pantoate--beta-alanine ligase/(d)CMP kinase [Prochlorococcus]|uniref:bifunctional pantoate--beta-alanine ligase/(d)CMP kinase n=1 Tax=Prochlorococcus TaxID=1218 RepID=UPI000533701B|nr:MULTISPECIES: bifunctional pantoate--beta-alanine ligase/(d)CMP kinase [Prochlorococcus]KGG13615.1 Pantoate--beta-alanine ligase [Prochlorococcus sp. MIT 0601]